MRVRLLKGLGEAELQGGVRSGIERLQHSLDLATRLPDPERRSHILDAAYQLGVAHLHEGLERNCLELRRDDGCVVPIREHGLHRSERSSREAMRFLRYVLDRTPEGAPRYAATVWLLNLAYMTIGKYPDGVPARYQMAPDIFTPASPFPYFENVATQAGLGGHVGYAGGTIVDDFDNDGYLDVVVSSLHSGYQMRFFRNTGDGRFADLTESSGLTGIFGGLHTVQTDYDNDGDLDILVLRGAWSGSRGRIPNSLLRNNGDLTFTDVTFDAGLAEPFYPTQAATWADFDNDGDLDLFVGNESTPDQESPSQLFRNEGNGRFVDIAAAAGVENLSFAKGVAAGDLDGDSFTDLYVSNLGSANRLYRNNRDGTFTDVAEVAGATGPVSSFSTWFWDVDNNGALDLLVHSYPLKDTEVTLSSLVRGWMGQPDHLETSKLYSNDGHGRLTDVAAAYGIAQAKFPMGSNFGDLDNDGYLDFYLGTGYMNYHAVIPNVMYRNDAGERFTYITYAGGFGHLAKGHGIAFADMDNDGDQDVFSRLGGSYVLDGSYDTLLENPGFGNHWITLKLQGTVSNRVAIGARIRIDIREGSKARSIYRVIGSGSSFGANPLRAEIGLGTADRIDRLEVYWPATKTTQTFRDVGVNRFLRITEGQAKLTELHRLSFKLGGVDR